MALEIKAGNDTGQQQKFLMNGLISNRQALVLRTGSQLCQTAGGNAPLTTALQGNGQNYQMHQRIMDFDPVIPTL